MQVTTPAIKWNDADGTAEVTQKSPLTGTIHTRVIRMTRQEYSDWRISRQLIQHALPALSPGEREFLMTGITDEEWASHFADDDEE